MVNKIIYFAYGSNLSKKQMSSRCPNSRPLRSIVLNNYELTFVGFEVRWNGGIATIIPRTNCVTYGALYNMTKKDVERLDEFEAIRSGIYYKKSLIIDSIQVYTYICNYKNQNHPSRKYLNKIKIGYEDWNLPVKGLFKPNIVINT